MRLLIALFASCVLALSASAHRVGVPLTTFEWNAKSNVWEIVHKLSLHDVEDYTRTHGLPHDFLETKEGEAWLRGFVENGFSIASQDRSLTYVGVEYDGEIAWVYYELRTSDPQISIESDLRFNKQTKLYSLLNVTRAGYTDSYIFRDGNRVIDVKLTGADEN